MASMSHPRRGEIYWVKLDPTVGSEISKTRPALIISNDVGNQYADRVIVAPISPGNTDRIYPFEVLLPADDAGLGKTSKALLDQIRTVDKQRLAGLIGALSGDRMEEVNRAIRRSLAV
jgi:mRNA interferase MazF